MKPAKQLPTHVASTSSVWHQDRQTKLQPLKALGVGNQSNERPSIPNHQQSLAIPILVTFYHSLGNLSEESHAGKLQQTVLLCSLQWWVVFTRRLSGWGQGQVLGAFEWSKLSK